MTIYKYLQIVNGKNISFLTDCVDNIMMKCINYDTNIVMLGDFNVNLLKSIDL